MTDKKAFGISDVLRQYIEAMVEELVLEDNSFEFHNKYLTRFCEAEGIDYNSLETHLIDFIDTAKELKVHESKGTERLLRILAKDCFVSNSNEVVEKLITNINNKRNERNLRDNFFHCLVNATRRFHMRQSKEATYLHKGTKVLMFGWEYPPHVFGELANANFAISEGLHEQGDIDITLCLPKSFGDENTSACKIISMCAVPIAYRDVNYDYVRKRIGSIMNPENYYRLRDNIYSDFNYMHVNDLGCMDFAGGYPKNLLEEINNYSVIAGVVARAEEFDIIQANDWPTYPAGIHSKIVSGKPLSIYVHATEFDRNHGKVNPTFYAIEKDGMDNADCIICVSDLIRQTVINQYHQDPKKCFTVHNA